MPFFSKTKKGGSGKGPKRRAGSLSSLTSQDEMKTDDNIAIKLQLDENELIFDSNAGQWYSESNVGGGGNSANLRKQNITLQEQNNALKLKNDILMDMVVALKADLAARDKEILMTNH